jgi:hypothetical protein
VRSLVPTYGRVSPATTVDTSTFGTPSGSTGAISLITKPAFDPPSTTTAATRPARCRSRTTAAAPRAIAETAAFRSAAAASA